MFLMKTGVYAEIKNWQTKSYLEAEKINHGTLRPLMIIREKSISIMNTRKKELDAAMIQVLQQPVQEQYAVYTNNLQIGFWKTWQETTFTLSAIVIQIIPILDNNLNNT